MSNEFVKRPSPSEDFEDLILEEEAFFKHKNPPSVKFNKSSNKPNSRFKQERPPPSQLPQQQPQILFDVKDRIVLSVSSFPQPSLVDSQNGFPTPYHRLDKRNFIKKSNTTNADIISEFRSFQGTQLDREINDENLKKLAVGLGDDDFEEIESQIEKLDPYLVAFLKKRAESKYGEKVKQNTELPIKSETKILKDQLFQPSNSIQNSTQLIPSNNVENYLESKKLEWINSDLPDPTKRDPNDKTETPKVASFRFNFKGLIHNPEDDLKVDLSSGLYHHGDEQEKPGYTIQELLFLTRSENQAQRSFALNIISEIIRNLRSGGLFDVEVDLEYWLYQLNVLLYITKLITDNNKTTSNTALITLSIYLNAHISSNEEIIWDRLFSTKLGLRSFSTGIKSIKNFRSQALGLSQLGSEPEKNDFDEKKGYMDGILAALKEDFVEGLLELGVLDLLIRFLDVESSICKPDSIANIVFNILCRLTRHSTTTCEEIMMAKSERLGLLLKRKYLSLNWPMEKPLISSVKLIRLLCQNSRVTTIKFFESGVLDLLMRYISISDEEDIPEKEIGYFESLKVEIFGVFRVVFGYRVGFRLVEEYQFLFGQFFSLETTTTTPFNSLTQLSHLFSEQIRGFGGGELVVDANYKVFIEKAVEYINNSFKFAKNFENEDWLEFVGALISFIVVYLKHLEKEKAKYFVSFLSSTKLARWDNLEFVKIIFKYLSNLNVQTDLFYRLPTFIESSTLGLSNIKRIKTASTMLKSTTRLNILSSLIDLTTKSSILHPKLSSQFLHSLTHASHPLLQILNLGMKCGWFGVHFGVERCDWIRIFGYGWNEFRRCWIEAAGGTSPLKRVADDDSEGREEYLKTRVVDLARMESLGPVVFDVSIDYLMDLLPGDECLGYRVFHTCIVGQSWMKFNLKIDQSLHSTQWAYLKQYFDGNMWDSKSLEQSEIVHSDKRHALLQGFIENGQLGTNLESFTFDLGRSTIEEPRIQFPLSVGWVFSPLDVIIDSNLVSNRTRNGRKVVVEEEGALDVDLVVRFLEFLVEVEKRIGGGGSGGGRNDCLKFSRFPFLKMGDNLSLASTAGKYVKLIGIYLLEDSVFLDPQVKLLVESLLSIYFDKNQLNFNTTTTSSNTKNIIDQQQSDHIIATTNELNRKFAFFVEQNSGGQIKFYRTFKKLLEQFSASSFGDLTFLKMILVPTMMGFHSDYRDLFYGEVLDIIRSSKGQRYPSLFFGKGNDREKIDEKGLGFYFTPFEESFGTVSVYCRGLVSGIFDELEFFRNVALGHVAGFLFVSGGEVDLEKREMKRKIVQALNGNSRYLDEVLGYDYLGLSSGYAGMDGDLLNERREIVEQLLK